MNFSIFVLKVALIALFSWLLSFFMPWWIFAVVAFVMGLLLQKSILLNFFSGLLGAGIYYVITAFWMGTNDNFSFANKVAEIFGEGLGMELSGYGLLWMGAALFSFIGALSSLGGAMLLTPEPGNRLQDSRRTKSKRLKLDI
jgi:hypothetical protein